MRFLCRPILIFAVINVQTSVMSKFQHFMVPIFAPSRVSGPAQIFERVRALYVQWFRRHWTHFGQQSSKVLLCPLELMIYNLQRPLIAAVLGRVNNVTEMEQRLTSVTAMFCCYSNLTS